MANPYHAGIAETKRPKYRFIARLGRILLPFKSVTRRPSMCFPTVPRNVELSSNTKYGAATKKANSQKYMALAVNRC
jgi:hypothetical protein